MHSLFRVNGWAMDGKADLAMSRLGLKVIREHTTLPVYVGKAVLKNE